MQLRGGYQQFSAELITPEATTIFRWRLLGEFEHHLAATLSTVGVEPFLAIGLFWQSESSCRLSVGMLMSKGSEQYEQSPSRVDAATFLDSSRQGFRTPPP